MNRPLFSVGLLMSPGPMPKKVARNAESLVKAGSGDEIFSTPINNEICMYVDI